MTKISCDVINDILPLYADDVVSGDTRELIEEHLAGCPECSRKLNEIRQDIKADIETQAAEAEKKAVVAAKKKQRAKRILTAVLSMIAGVVMISIIVGAMTLIRIPVEYNESRFRAGLREEGGEHCLYLRYNGKMQGHNLVSTIENNGKMTLYIEIYNTPWNNIFGGDSDNVWNEILVLPVDVDDDHVTELRLITGDIKQMYSPTRDYEGLIKDSVLLWERE